MVREEKSQDGQSDELGLEKTRLKSPVNNYYECILIHLPLKELKDAYIDPPFPFILTTTL